MCGCLLSALKSPSTTITTDIKDNKCPFKSDCCNNDRYFCCLKLTITDDHINEIVKNKIIKNK